MKKNKYREISYDAYKAQDLLIDKKDGILTVTFNQPDSLNAFSGGMHLALTRIWDDIQDDAEVDVVVLTGAGKAFSAGGNLVTMQQKIDDPDWWEATTEPEAKRIVYRMLECDKPIIARVNGHAAGLGATIALLCDIIYMAEDAKIGDPHVKAGFPAADGGALMWPQLIGYARAKEFLFTGKMMTAAQAVQIGLVNHAVPLDQLDQHVYEMARTLADGATKAIRWTKQVVNLPLRQIAHSTMDLSLSLETRANLTSDHQEAVRAFSEKRKPVFTGS